MRRALLACLVVLGVAFALRVGLQAAPAQWPGIDETVVERVAVAAGRPPRPPYLDLGQGDLPLFMFLLAGACGGFLAGYNFRILFPPADAASR